MANSEKQSITLKVNGKDHHLEILPWVSLLDALRERIHLTGTKIERVRFASRLQRIDI